jgi:hypothetical protein
VLAGEPDVVGITQLIGARAAERNAFMIQGYGGGIAIQIADDKLARRSLSSGGQSYSLSLP